MATEMIEQTASAEVENEGEAMIIMDRLDNNLLDPQSAAQMVAGLRPDTLVYVVPVKSGKPVVGLSASGAQILATRRGGLETLQDYAITPIRLMVEVRDEYGSVAAVEEVEGVRAAVRVKDLRTGTVFTGVDDEPCWIMLKAGGKKPDTKASVKAYNKAERNALNKHFSAIEKVVQEFAQQAIQEGRAYFAGPDEPQGPATQPPPARAKVTVRPARPPEADCNAEQVAAIQQALVDAGLGNKVIREWCARNQCDTAHIPASKFEDVLTWIAEVARIMAAEAREAEQEAVAGEVSPEEDDPFAEQGVAEAADGELNV